MKPPTRSASASPARDLFLAGIFFALATLIVYGPALRGEFLWDDDRYVSQNPYLQSLDGLRQIWLRPGGTDQYYPLVFTSFWIEYRLWGPSTLGYHLVNVLLHAANAMLIWRILSRLRVPGAGLAAAVFALHPVHVESVAWITERKNVLSGFFYLAAMLSYLKWARVEGSRGQGAKGPRDQGESASGHERAFAALGGSSRLNYGCSLGLFACALLSKTVTASLPAAILVVIWWKRGRIVWRDAAPLLPFFAIGALGGLTTAWLERRHVGAAGPEWDLSFVERCLIAGRAVWFYLGKLVFPANLTFIYPRWRIDASDWRQFILPLTTIGLPVFLWMQRDRLGRGPLAAALFFGGTLLPALGFLNVYPMRFSFVADHFQYLASIGPITLMAAALAWIARSGRFAILKSVRRGSMVGAAAVLLILAVLTFRQASIYRSLRTLWGDTLRKNPAAWLAHNNYGMLLADPADRATAMGHFREAIRLNPWFFEAHYNLANRLRDEGRTDDAITHYRECLRLRADYVKAHYNLGHLLEQLGRLDEASHHFSQVVRHVPDDQEAYYKLGDIAAKQGRWSRAADQYAKSLALRPANAPAHRKLADALAHLGRTREAVEHYRQALRVRPDYAEARRGLAALSGAASRPASGAGP